jgi:hypothetical protein
MVILLGSQLAACATVIKGTTQSVSVNTPPTQGATCTLTSSEGTWYITSPGSVEVGKTKNNLDINCTKDGFHNATASIEPQFQAATFGNVLAGGLVGVAVDAASGANYEYPSPIDVQMTPSNQPMPPPAPAAGADAATDAAPNS